MRSYKGLPFSIAILMLFFAVSAYAAITGVISGTVTDSTGAVVPGVTVTVLNQDTGVKQTQVSDSKGFFSFPVLDIGSYTINATQTGFESFHETDIKVDANSSVRADIALKVGSVTQTEEVTSNAVQVETQSTQLGEVIETGKITAVPLNGRAFTDLLALQPGVSPYNGTSETASGPGSSVSGSLNAGNTSINGGREASNGYMVNGGDVNDGVANGTAIVPNLDAISEFRIITDNFDAEYGNFSGGQVNVVTKNGTNQWHGSGFEFLRNAIFNARGYNFSPPPPKGVYTQNIYGGTFGGPIRKDKVFFFADYQGTKRSIGTTDSTQVPTAADLTGNVSDLAFLMTPANNDFVNGVGWASVLTKRLGYTVTNGENYYLKTCTNTTQCVFPNAIIPKSAWDPVSANLFKYFPAANSTIINNFSPTGTVPAYVTTSAANTLTDNKEALRVDFNTRYGTLFAYYFLDNDLVGSPYGGGTAGGFGTSNTTRAQLANVGLTSTFKNNSVNTFRFTYMRSAWHSSNPLFTEPGPSLASLGFVTPWGAAGGVSPVVPGLEGVPQISIDGLSFGTPNATDGHFDNTFQWLDNYMKVIGLHTLQVGASYHYDQIDERNNTGENGVYSFSDDQETGDGFADFLLGADAGSYNQSSVQILDDRSNYAAAYFEDSWRARPNLTLNYGIRYEISTPWYDTNNKIEAIIPGEQSKVFPGAPLGWVFPGDAGVPRTLAAIKYDKFAPRFGFSYAPSGSSEGFMSKILGGPGMFSIRGGAGLFYSNFQEQSGYQEAGDSPYGEYYTAPVGTMLSAPYIDRGTQNIEVPKFPFNWPAKNVSPSNPNTTYNWAAAEPIGGSPVVDVHNTMPYIEEYNLSLQRGLGRSTVLTVNYVGSQGRHLANSRESNPGNAALCLSYSGSALAPGQAKCGPKLEAQNYKLANGTVVPGTRLLNIAAGAIAYTSNAYQQTHATSNFNSLQANLKHTSKMWDVLLGYTYGRSMDNASDLGDPIYVYNPQLSYGLSRFNVAQYFVASYNLHLPFANWTGNRYAKAVVGGWSITGISKFATGLPISLSETNDKSLTALSDVPNYTPGNLNGGGLLGDHNPRDINPATNQHYPWFNTTLFTQETTGVFGNAARDFFSGPGLDHTDVAVLREFHIHENHTVSFRAEAFNVLNHTEFGAPSGSVTSTTFGVITSGGSNSRVGQVAVKYRF